MREATRLIVGAGHGLSGGINFSTSRIYNMFCYVTFDINVGFCTCEVVVTMDRGLTFDSIMGGSSLPFALLSVGKSVAI